MRQRLAALSGVDEARSSAAVERAGDFPETSCAVRWAFDLLGFVDAAGTHANLLCMSLTRRLQVLIDDDRAEALEREAARADISVGALVREAIDERLAPSAGFAISVR